MNQKYKFGDLIKNKFGRSHLEVFVYLGVDHNGNALLASSKEIIEVFRYHENEIKPFIKEADYNLLRTYFYEKTIHYYKYSFCYLTEIVGNISSNLDDSIILI